MLRTGRGIEGVKAIYTVKKKIIKKILEHEYNKVKEEIKDREENEWRRTTTPVIREMMLDSMQQDRDSDCSLRKAIDMFSLIYDSDDPYAYMFHDFIQKVRGKNDLPVMDKYKQYLKKKGEMNYNKKEVEDKAKEEQGLN